MSLTLTVRLDDDVKARLERLAGATRHRQFPGSREPANSRC